MLSCVITVIFGYVITVISGDVRPQEVTKARGIKIEINHQFPWVDSRMYLHNFIRSVTVSIPSNVPLASFRGIENQEITDDIIARLEAFVPSAGGDDKR